MRLRGTVASEVEALTRMELAVYHPDGTVRLRGAVLAVWLAFLLGCMLVMARTSFVADMSAFLPRSPTPAQQLLVDQLTEGVLSRLLLVGIEGSTPSGRAELSRSLAKRLEDGGLFLSVRNGDAAVLSRDRELLFANRYLLSPSVTPERFTPEGLHAAISESIDLLASPIGLMLKGQIGRAHV